MRLAPPIIRRRRKPRHGHEESERGSISGVSLAGMPLYLKGGGKSAARNFGSLIDSTLPQPAAENLPEAARDLPVVFGEGETTQAVAYGLALRGRTDASFSNSFATENGQAGPAKGCPECAADECIQATGTLVSTFEVSTAVTLPSVDDFPNLTPCQRARVQSAITNVLAPHEQQHVTAFQTYNATVRTPFNLRLCRAEFDARIQSLHDGIEATRRARAQEKSDALDPFNFEVDLNCQDRPSSPAPGAGGKQSSSD